MTHVIDWAAQKEAQRRLKRTFKRPFTPNVYSGMLEKTVLMFRSAGCAIFTRILSDGPSRYLGPTIFYCGLGACSSGRSHNQHQRWEDASFTGRIEMQRQSIRVLLSLVERQTNDWSIQSYNCQILKEDLLKAFLKSIKEWYRTSNIEIEETHNCSICISHKHVSFPDKRR